MTRAPNCLQTAWARTLYRPGDILQCVQCIYYTVYIYTCRNCAGHEKVAEALSRCVTLLELASREWRELRGKRKIKKDNTQRDREYNIYKRRIVKFAVCVNTGNLFYSSVEFNFLIKNDINFFFCAHQLLQTDAAKHCTIYGFCNIKRAINRKS